jgi:hypothetical protein
MPVKSCIHNVCKNRECNIVVGARYFAPLSALFVVWVIQFECIICCMGYPVSSHCALFDSPFYADALRIQELHSLEPVSQRL